MNIYNKKVLLISLFMWLQSSNAMDYASHITQQRQEQQAPHPAHTARQVHHTHTPSLQEIVHHNQTQHDEMSLLPQENKNV